MRVDEIMTREVISASIDDSVEKCAKLLMDNQISGVPVLDKSGRVVGMLTEGDLIRREAHYEAPGLIEILGGQVYLDDPLEFLENLRRAMALRAGRLMSREVISVSPEDPVENAATEMVQHNIDRLPVVNQERKLEGIISRKDIMRALFSGELEGEKKHAPANNVNYQN